MLMVFVIFFVLVLDNILYGEIGSGLVYFFFLFSLVIIELRVRRFWLMCLFFFNC